MNKITLLLLSATSIVASPLHIKLDPQQTAINLTLADVLHTVHGTFKLTKGEIWVDPETGKAGGEIVVAADSGNSGSHARDSRMDKNVLEVQRFPTVTFAPDRVEGHVNTSGNSEFKLHGNFNIHGASHELTMAVTSHIELDHVTANASFDVPYVNWGMKDPSTLFLRVSNIAKIDVSGVGTAQ